MQGACPQSLDELRALPGVGEYTARAVAAICFGSPVAAVDTNIRRVVLRLYGQDAAAHEARPGTETRQGIGPQRIQAMADGLVDPGAPAAWTHAMMDVGATTCRPRQLACGICPLEAWCATAAASRPIWARQPTQPARATTPSMPFPQTTRWLRGRIVERLRSAKPDEWLTFDRPIGSHDAPAVARAVAALASEGMLDVRDGCEARLATRAVEASAA